MRLRISVDSTSCRLAVATAPRKPLRVAVQVLQGRLQEAGGVALVSRGILCSGTRVKPASTAPELVRTRMLVACMVSKSSGSGRVGREANSKRHSLGAARATCIYCSAAFYESRELVRCGWHGQRPDVQHTWPRGNQFPMQSPYAPQYNMLFCTDSGAQTCHQWFTGSLATIRAGSAGVQCLRPLLPAAALPVAAAGT